MKTPIILFAAVLSAFACLPQSQADEPVIRDSLAVQKARNEHVQSRGKKTFYTERWDLSALPHYVPERKVFGSIRMWGSNYFFDGNLGKYWEEGFRKFQPDITFANNFRTPNVALAVLFTNAADIGVGTYNFMTLEAFQRHMNYDPLEISVMTGAFDIPGWSNALCIFVNKANPVAQLSMRQLDGIFGSARTGGWIGTEWHPEFARGADQNIRTWGQVGLTGEWAGKRINVYGNNLRYGQAVYFSDHVLKGSDKWNEDLRMYANYARAGDGTLAIGNAELVKDLGRDCYGIAYSGAQNLSPDTKIVPLQIEDNGPAIMPSIQTVHDRTYPLHYQILMYVARPPGMPMDPKLKEYFRYVLSQEGQAEVMRDGKWLPLTPEVARAQLQKLE